MPTFLVTYDLKAPGRDYEPVWNYLKATGVHWHAQDSVWFIESSLNAGGIRDELKALIDSNDEVLVIRVDGQNWASLNMGGGSDWMHRHVAG
jgi:hypothetical protein